MKQLPYILLAIGLVTSMHAQVGIGTTSPQGALDIVSTNSGLVVPRVPNVESVTDGNGNSPTDGTIVYDISRQRTCFRIAGSWLCLGTNAGNGNADITIATDYDTSVYIKASNTDAGDLFSENNISLSDDGNYLAVAAYSEDSNATGINGNQSDNSATESGAVYVFVNSGGIWSQQAYIKASNTDVSDQFGYNLDINSDGSRLVVGTVRESSSATGINGNQADNSAANAGAAYIFVRSGTVWSQEAYLKSSNTDPGDLFGAGVSISDDGTRVAIGATNEASNATGVNGNELDNSLAGAGAVYVFLRTGSTWTQETYIKASNTEAGDGFGSRVSLSGDGLRLAVKASSEDSNATGINGNQVDNSSISSGAAYIFSRSGSVWTQEAYIKASNTGANDRFAENLVLNQDGSTLAVTAENEDSNATGINGDQTNDLAFSSGAVYVFTRSGITWTQQAYLKASNAETGDRFGYHVDISNNGDALVVSTPFERSNATGIGGDQSDNSLADAGAIYIFERNAGVWSQISYGKASNTEFADRYGYRVSINGDGSIIAVGAELEDSNATGVGGNQLDNSANASGAVYIIQ